MSADQNPEDATTHTECNPDLPNAKGHGNLIGIEGRWSWFICTNCGDEVQMFAGGAV